MGRKVEAIGSETGLAAGAALGASICIATGPLGAIAGTIPCAVVGEIIGLFLFKIDNRTLI